MRKVLLFCTIAMLSVSFVFPQFIYAHTTGAAHSHSGEGGTVTEGAVLTNPLSNISSIPAFFLAIIDILMIFAVPFIVFFIIYAGFLYVTARGNAETIKKAHNALLYALIGGLLILGSRTLLTIIENTVTQIK